MKLSVRVEWSGSIRPAVSAGRVAAAVRSRIEDRLRGMSSGASQPDMAGIDAHREPYAAKNSKDR